MFPGTAPVGASVSILSSMITPTILILAAASLVSATTSRLMRIMESMRELSESFERHLEYEHDRLVLDEEQMSLMVQIERTTKRVRLMQYTVALLHLAITAFVLSMVTLGLEAAVGLGLGLTPVISAMLGAILLLVSIVMLVHDAVIAVAATREEAYLTLRMTEYHAAQTRRMETSTRYPVSWS